MPLKHILCHGKYIQILSSTWTEWQGKNVHIIKNLKIKLSIYNVFYKNAAIKWSDIFCSKSKMQK